MKQVKTLLLELGQVFREEQERHRNWRMDLFSTNHVVHLRVHHVLTRSVYYKRVYLISDETTIAKHLAATLNEFRAVCAGYARKEDA